MNNVQLSGRLVRDPEIKMTPSGKKYARFTVAVSRGTHKSPQQQADFISCTAWDKLADVIEKYFPKGKGIVISSGRITTNTFTTKDGRRVFTTDVTVDAFEFPIISKLEQHEASTTQSAQADVQATTNPQTEFVPMESDIEIPFE